jgi:hypothetical protein
VISFVPEAMLDLLGFMVARRLMEQGLDPDRQLIVRLLGADFDLIRAPLGAAAAKPLVNFGAPLKEPTPCLYRRPAHRHG